MSRPKPKSKSSATSSKPSVRANQPVATGNPAKAGAGKAAAKKSPVAKSVPIKATANKSAKRTPSPRETARTRAPTISVRGEDTRSRTTAASPRTRHDSVADPAIEVAPHDATATSALDLSADASDPARAAELAALEEQVETLTAPDLLVALATRIDTLGMQLAYAISRHVNDPAHVAPLKPVLMRVPALYGKTLLRAAEKFDDLGSPRRAAYVLFEALRKAFDPDVITSVASALSFILEAHGQAKSAVTIRGLLAEREDRRARGEDRREVRTQFAAALEALRDGGVEWDALDDVTDQFD